MASTDARPVPRKNTAFRYYFCIRKNDGTLITSWTGADSNVSIDGAAFSACTNEATEIGTTGCGYIDFTSSEMNGDAIVYKLTVTNTSALTLVVTFFPEEVGDYRVNVEQFGGSAGTFAGGKPEVNSVQFSGQTITAAAGVTLPSSVASPTNITAGTITTVTNLTNAPTSGDLTAAMKTSVQTAVQAALDANIAEIAAIPAVTAPLTTMVKYLFELARNKVTQDATTQTLFKDDGVTSVGTSAVSDAAGTFTRAKFV